MAADKTPGGDFENSSALCRCSKMHDFDWPIKPKLPTYSARAMCTYCVTQFLPSRSASNCKCDRQIISRHILLLMLGAPNQIPKNGVSRSHLRNVRAPIGQCAQPHPGKTFRVGVMSCRTVTHIHTSNPDRSVSQCYQSWPVWILCSAARLGPEGQRPIAPGPAEQLGSILTLHQRPSISELDRTQCEHHSRRQFTGHRTHSHSSVNVHVQCILSAVSGAGAVRDMHSQTGCYSRVRG